MLFKTPNLPSLKYNFIRTNLHKKYKDNKGQEPSKTLCVTGISGTLYYTAPFTSVIINSYNRILKTSARITNIDQTFPP